MTDSADSQPLEGQLSSLTGSRGDHQRTEKGKNIRSKKARMRK